MLKDLIRWKSLQYLLHSTAAGHTVENVEYEAEDSAAGGRRDVVDRVVSVAKRCSERRLKDAPIGVRCQVGQSDDAP